MKPLAICCIIAALAIPAFLWVGGEIPLFHHESAVAEHPESSQTSGRTIFAAGVVEGATREVPLNFEISGRLVAINVTEGTRVRAKTILAKLDDAVLQDELKQAESRFALAKAERERLVNGASRETRERILAEAERAAVMVEQAKIEANRALAAFKRDAITQELCDQYRFRLKSAVADLKRARARVAEVEAAARSDEIKMADARIKLASAQVAQARTMIAKTLLRSPSAGIVLKIDAELGEHITVGRTQHVMTLVDDGRVQVRAYVEELDAVALTVGQHAEVTVDGLPLRRFDGHITWIAPSMQPKTQLHNRPGERIDTRVREVLIEIENPNGLVIGMPVDVFLNQRGNALTQTARKSPLQRDNSGPMEFH